MDRKFNIDRLFTDTMRKTKGSTSATTSLDITIGYQRTAVKEEYIEEGRYNRAVRGYCNMRLPNGKRYLSRSLCLYNFFTMMFNRITYYCKKVGREYFALYLETLIHTVHMFDLVVFYLFAVCFIFTMMDTQASSLLL